MPPGSSTMKPREGSESVYCFQVLPAVITSRMRESASPPRLVGSPPQWTGPEGVQYGAPPAIGGGRGGAVGRALQHVEIFALRAVGVGIELVGQAVTGAQRVIRVR